MLPQVRLGFIAWTLLMSATLPGCVAQPARTGVVRYTTTTACVDAISALQPRSIPPPDKNDSPAVFVFDSSSVCLRDAQNTRRPALLLSLAEVSIPAEILISSSGRGEVTLAPLISVLDKDFIEQSRYPFEKFTKRGTDFSMSVFLNDAGRQPAYLLIVADDVWLGKDNLTVAGKSQTTVWSTGLVTGAYTSGYEARQLSTFSDLGSLTIKRKSYAPPSLEETHN
ncbi:hypothetical protein ELE36_01455 [Pseudolysobacter antarcticus]|uniref:Lipoprotein n=1 Tax=Pseudolysobacter antarcticus TaxID=2511995 RepID=A0A411HFA0_9GAMM|nr:hypothetical protein [Pseudolysobacter antarcticus]QBB69151.1 hypothetical protein ELE36_01455 [Pseudolysobacter antarcticus]